MCMCLSVRNDGLAKREKDRIRINIAATKFLKLSYAKQFMQEENTMEKCVQLNS